MNLLAFATLCLFVAPEPRITVAGIQFGQTSTDELVKRLGKPEVLIGQHPNSRHHWTLKNGLCIAVDGGQANAHGNGYVIDVISLSNWKGDLLTALKANNLTPSFALLSPLKIGMTKQQAVNALGISSGSLTEVSSKHSTLKVNFGNAEGNLNLTLKLFWDERRLLRELIILT